MKFTFGLSIIFFGELTSIIKKIWVKMSSISNNLFLELNKLVGSTNYFNWKIELSIY